LGVRGAVEEEKRADMTNTNKPKDWIDEIQDKGVTHAL
jgi:hypothetical protein